MTAAKRHDPARRFGFLILFVVGWTLMFYAHQDEYGLVVEFLLRAPLTVWAIILAGKVWPHS